jgi:excisionase family DNA binding protein
MHPNTNDPPKLAYSIREGVAATSLSKTTLYAMIAAGKLRAVRVGGRTVIPAESLHALIHEEG